VTDHVQLGKRAGFDNVGHCLSLIAGTLHRSVSVRCQVFLQAMQCPWPVGKWFRTQD